MLHIIEGLSGYGKTSYIWNHISKNILEKKFEEKKIIILVPEQVSFESEKMFCKLQKNYRTTNIEVVNFKRLSNIILRELGGLTKKTLSDVKNNIILNIVLFEIKNNLKVYKRQVSNEYFVKEILLFFNILKNNNISCERILYFSEITKNKLLSAKLEDIYLIYKNFEDKINKKYIDNSDIINLAYQKLEKSDFFKNYIVYIDGFKSFTNSEYNILEKVVSQSEDVYLTLCLNNKNNINNNNIFNLIFQTKNKFLEIANKNNIKIAPIIYLNKNFRFKNQALMLLEKNICDILNSKKIKDNNFDWSTQDDFNIFEFQTKSQEIEFIAAQISDLIKKNNFKFNQVLIITRDLNLYRSYIDYIFKIYEIPYFLDERKLIKDQRLIIFVLALLEAVNSNLKTIFILKLLKTDFFDFDFEIISKLEIYCDIWNIDKDLWLEDFSFNPRGFSEIFTSEDKILLAEINNIRKKIVEILINLKQKLNKKNTGKEFVKIIYEYLIDLKIDEQLRNFINQNNQDIVFIQENIKVWDGLIEIFDDITDIVGEKIISLKEFINLFSISISNFDLGSVPQTLDQVIITQADHMITSNARAVFVIGLNQGSFPKVSQNTPVFSSLENKNLVDIGLNLYNYYNNIEISLTERYYIYKSITCASEKVFLSYYKYNIDSKILPKAFFINQIEFLFKNLKIKKIDDSNMIFVQNKQTAYNYICKNFNNNTQELISVREYLKNDIEFKDKINRLERLNNKKDFNIINKSLLKNFLKNKLNISPSSVERYHICSFKFLFSDIFKIRNIKKVDFSNLEQGVVLHYLLKQILENQDKLNLENAKDKISNLIKDYVNKTMGKHIVYNNKNQYISNQLVEDVFNLVNYINTEQAGSSFKAKKFELEISENSNIKPLYLNLKTGETIVVSGKIDRVDFCESDNKKYIRVIDYKSGNKDFCLDDVYFGLNMQMLLYLFIIKNYYLNNNLVFETAGVLYLSIKPKIVFLERNSKNNLDYNYNSNGLLIDDIEILSLMEKDLKKDLKAKFLPVKLNKDLSLSKTSSVLSKSCFDLLENYIKNKLLSMASAIFDGKFLARPIESNRYKNVCDYCEYKSICNFGSGEDKVIKTLEAPPEDWIKKS